MQAGLRNPRASGRMSKPQASCNALPLFELCYNILRDVAEYAAILPCNPPAAARIAKPCIAELAAHSRSVHATIPSQLPPPEHIASPTQHASPPRRRTGIDAPHLLLTHITNLHLPHLPPPPSPPSNPAHHHPLCRRTVLLQTHPGIRLRHQGVQRSRAQA